MIRSLLLVLWLLIEISINPIQENSFSNRLSEAAIALTKIEATYDPSYFSIEYPNGDIPEGKGVHTDVVIRACRKLGIDLQKEVHEDMNSNFDLYPKNWVLSHIDKNIDHRRVPNLMTYFKRHGEELEVSQNVKDYKPGDIVSWDLEGGTTHIGIVVSKKSFDGECYLISHNIGNGQELSDCLFKYKIIGHYAFKE